MKEYIRSGGDITIVVASDKEVKVQPVREAFQKVLGRATIYGIPAKVRGGHFRQDSGTRGGVFQIFKIKVKNIKHQLIDLI